ncbi:hypothetical protein ACKXGF_07760 [Alkalibacillus sp. S2W]|uniref:hypothetical protein n=1 Tax=Alkalibacillus sp. S2W TaxID=3386553 RepID=UPI00398C8D3B
MTDIKKFEQYEKEIENAVKAFKKADKDMHKSENPYFTPEVIDYELKLQKETLEKTVKETREKFNREIEETIEEQKERANRSSFHVSQSSKDFVENTVNEAVADISLALNDKEALEGFKRFEDKLDSMNEAELYHLRKQLPGMLNELADANDTIKSKLRMTNSALSELKTEEETLLEELENLQLKGVDFTFRRLKMTHRFYKPNNNNTVIRTW